MRWGLIRKTLRETWITTLIFASMLMVVEILLTTLLPVFSEELSMAWLRLEIVQKFLRALLAADAGDLIGPHILVALPWVHPVCLALVWAHEITFCTRVPAAEIDRGTIDIFLGLPVSRTQVYASETVGWLLSGLFILGLGLAAIIAGTLLAAPEALPPAGQLAAAFANSFSLYAAVGGFTFLVSSLSSRKGQAVGWVFGVVLGSFLLSFLACFWEPARALDFLSFLTYYRPISIFQGRGWPAGDIASLVLTGLACWTYGWWVFRSRDIYTL